MNNQESLTPLQIAAKSGNKELISTFLSIQPTYMDGKTMALALENHHIDILVILMDAARPRDSDVYGFGTSVRAFKILMHTAWTSTELMELLHYACGQTKEEEELSPDSFQPAFHMLESALLSTAHNMLKQGAFASDTNRAVLRKVVELFPDFMKYFRYNTPECADEMLRLVET